MSRNITVGTTPVNLANHANGKRLSIVISMLPGSAAAANTGTISIAKGRQPTSATPGTGNNGEIWLRPGGNHVDDAQTRPGIKVWQGEYWAISDTAGQIVTVDEVYDS